MDNCTLCVCTVQGEGDGEIYEVSVKVCFVPVNFVSLACNIAMCGGDLSCNLL